MTRIVGIYAPEKALSGFRLRQFAQGAEGCGWKSRIYPLQSTVDRDLDIVVVAGAPWKYRSANLKICKRHAVIGIPYINIELGWLYKPRRPLRWFTYVNKFPYVPPFSCPHDRRLKMNMEAKFQPRGEEILIIGQNRAIDKKIEKRIRKIRRYTDRKIVYRPRRPANHPRWRAIDGYEIDDHSRPVAQAIADSWCAITDYSNMGGECLAAGVPVISSDRASFAEFGNHSLKNIDSIQPPDKEQVNDWLARMAYILWDSSEFASGEAFSWLLENCEEIHA